jgi:urocanate hydratase
MEQSNRQADILRIYGTLVAEQEDWAGTLVLSYGKGAAVSGIAAAVSIAGGTTLVLDDDAAAVKSAMRRGELDFVVNTLDEALRTLKNQIRQRRPLSVGLIAEVTTVLKEMEERGVLPDRRYSQIPERMLPSYKSLQGYQILAANTEELRRIDDQLLAMISAEDLARRHWVQRAPQYLREARTGNRWIWLSEQERDQIRDLFQISPASR